jgi:hypothetical protein
MRFGYRLVAERYRKELRVSDSLWYRIDERQRRRVKLWQRQNRTTESNIAGLCLAAAAARLDVLVDHPRPGTRKTARRTTESQQTYQVTNARLLLASLQMRLKR